MNEMIERVARTIREGRQCGSREEPLHVPCPFCNWEPDERTPDHDETGCMWLARAAIAAMREPTEAMVEAAYASEDTGYEFSHRGDEAPAVWRAMVDEALK